MLSRVPAPSPVFVGREVELERLERSLERLRVGLIYGVAGVGKSALAYAMGARWPGRVVYHRVSDGESLESLLGDVRRQLADGPVPPASSVEELLDDLIGRMDASAALFVLDDLHRLPARAQAQLLGELGQTLARGRLLATSRELILEAQLPDRQEIRLGGLDGAAARALWASLDELYGAAAGLEPALERTRGNPLLLRRAHAGELDENDAIGATVRGLDPDERRLAAALALAHVSLPVRLVDELLPSGRGREVRKRLVARMVVDRPQDGTCAIHDLFREALLGALAPDERRGLEAELAAGLLRAAELDPVIRVREVCRHLRALDRHGEAGELLIATAAELVRHGAAAELLHLLEAIPPEHRSVEVQVARARTLMRVLDLRGAYDELQRLIRANLGSSQELKISLGQVATLTANLDVAVAVLQDVLADPTLPVPRRARAVAALALARTHQGHGEAARAFIDEVSRTVGEPLTVGAMELTRAFTLWVDEHDELARDSLERTQAVLRRFAGTYRSSAVAPTMWVGTLARMGRFQEAEEQLRLAEHAARNEDLLLRLGARTMYATYLVERGDRLEGLSELQSLSHQLERAGYLAGSLWADAWTARILYILGRRAEAERLATRTQSRAQARGILSVARLAERARGEDPVARLSAWREPPPSSKRGCMARHCSLDALRAAAGGDAVRTRALLDQLAPLAVGLGYAIDRAIGHLAEATLTRLQGSAAGNVTALEHAERELHDEGADADLLHRLADAIGHVRVVTPTLRKIVVEPEKDLSAWDVVLDRRSHELHLGKRTLDLKSRPVLRHLLYLLAGVPGRVVSKEELTHALWGGRYNPLVHDNAIKVNVARLRKLLARCGLTVGYEQDGYSLAVPERFLFITADD